MHAMKATNRRCLSQMARRLLHASAAAAAAVGIACTIVLVSGRPPIVSANVSNASVPHALQGVAAPSGYQVVAQKFDNFPNFTRATVSCPAGKVVIGGGAEAQGNNSILNGSFPAPGNTGWVGIGHQPGFNSVGIMVYAICAA
jgi:DhnA family fructose-bisphosphate aldolase class Ia